MSIDSFLNEISQNNQNRVKRKVTRIHVFYEGEVTERQVIQKLLSHLGNDSKLVETIEINVSAFVTNSINQIYDVVSEMKYSRKVDSKTEEQVIFEHDFIVFFLDFDVFSNFNYPVTHTSQANQLRRKFLRKTKKIAEICAHRNLYFKIAPSFRMIEYSICLGCIQNLVPIESVTIEVESIFSVFDVTIHKTLRRATKDFETIIDNDSFFSTEIMINKAKELRVLSGFPENIYDFMINIKKADYFHNITDIMKKPFSYIDTLHESIKEINSMDF